MSDDSGHDIAMSRSAYADGWNDAIHRVFNFLEEEGKLGTAQTEFKLRRLADKIRRGEF